MSHSIIEEPASNCKIKPAVTIGPIPNCINVPLFEAKITLNELNELWTDAETP